MNTLVDISADGKKIMILLNREAAKTLLGFLQRTVIVPTTVQYYIKTRLEECIEGLVS